MWRGDVQYFASAVPFCKHFSTPLPRSAFPVRPQFRSTIFVFFLASTFRLLRTQRFRALVHARVFLVVCCDFEIALANKVVHAL